MSLLPYPSFNISIMDSGRHLLLSSQNLDQFKHQSEFKDICWGNELLLLAFFFFLSCFKKSILHMSQKFDDKISYFLFVEKKSWNFVLPFVIVPYHNPYMWVFSILTKNIFWFCSLCTCDPKNEFTTTFILLNNSQIILLVSIQLWSLICGGTLLKVL